MRNPLESNLRGKLSADSGAESMFVNVAKYIFRKLVLMKER